MGGLSDGLRTAERRTEITWYYDVDAVGVTLLVNVATI